MRPSQNLPLPPRLYPPFHQLYATLPESTPPSYNITPPPFNNYMRPSHNLPLSPRIYPPFQQIHMCDPLRIYPSLPDYTLLFKNYMRPSQNLPLPPRIYPPPFQQLYAILPESTPLSQNIPPFSTTIIFCDPPRIYPFLP